MDDDNTLEKPKTKRDYVKTPARDEAIKNMRKAREMAINRKKIEAEAGKLGIVDPTPIAQPIVNVIKEVKEVVPVKPVEPIVNVIKEVKPKDEKNIIINKVKKKPTIVYLESDSESEPEQIIIKKKKKPKKIVVESSSESESEEEEEKKEIVKRPLPLYTHLRQAPKLRFL